MSAATTPRTRHHDSRGLDRLTLVVGLALVDWSRSRAARRALSDRPVRRPRTGIDEERLRAARLEHDSVGYPHFR